MNGRRCQACVDKPDSAETKMVHACINIIVINGNDDTSNDMSVNAAMTCEEFVQMYKATKGMPSESMIVVKYKGRDISISSSGHKSLSNLGVEDGSVVFVIEAKSQPINSPSNKAKKKGRT